MKSKIFSIFFSSFLFLVSGSFVLGANQVLLEGWDRSNNPFNLDRTYLLQFDQLPLSGKTLITPWSDTYWPTYAGGIAKRWLGQRDYSGRPFHYTTHSQQEIERMSLGQLQKLSPAEKYDIFNGDFDYPTVKRELNRTYPYAPSWYGLCHGWAAASVLYSEPRPVVLTSSDGIRVPFGSSDIKALLIYRQGELTTAPGRFLGLRCNLNFSRDRNSSGANSRECRDTNAGAFHLVLTNQVGRLRVPFIADLTRDDEVWNFPIFEYSSEIVSDRRRASTGAAPGTVREVTFRTRITYAVAISPAWEAVGAASLHKEYRYRVELNASGNVIGGEWLTFDRPDFLWTQVRAQSLADYSAIDVIYQASLGENQ